jgi:hypothetical protein
VLLLNSAHFARSPPLCQQIQFRPKNRETLKSRDSGASLFARKKARQSMAGELFRNKAVLNQYGNSRHLTTAICEDRSELGLSSTPPAYPEPAAATG